MYRVNQKVVYPGHGVALIQGIIEKKIDNKTVTFYELKLINKGMTILTPTTNTDIVGLRPLSSPQEIDTIFKNLMIPARKQRHDCSLIHNWNRRNKDYQSKLRTGSLSSISEIYFDLLIIAQNKELSFGEKSLLHQTEILLTEEIAAVNKAPEDATLEQLRSLLQTSFCQASL